MEASVAEPPALAAAPDPEPERQAVQLPLFEKCRITKYTVNFGGNVEIGDMDLIDALKLNKEAELTIRVRVASRGHKVQRDGEGNVTGTVSSSNLVVERIALDSEGDE